MRIKAIGIFVTLLFLATGAISLPSEGAPSMMSWPVKGPIISHFGYQRNPFTGVTDFHSGIDIGVDIGTTVKAAATGMVTLAQWYGGYGNFILMDHGDGISTAYAHLSRLDVKVGQFIQRGQVIGTSGATGSPVGSPHLHFEVLRKGTPINPLPLLH